MPDDNTAIVLGEFAGPSLLGLFEDGTLRGEFSDPVFVGASFQGPQAVGEGDEVVGEDDEAVGG